MLALWPDLAQGWHLFATCCSMYALIALDSPTQPTSLGHKRTPIREMPPGFVCLMVFQSNYPTCYPFYVPHKEDVTKEQFPQRVSSMKASKDFPLLE